MTTPAELRRLLAAAKGKAGSTHEASLLRHAAANALPGLLSELDSAYRAVGLQAERAQRAEANCSTLKASLRTMAQRYSEASMEVEKLRMVDACHGELVSEITEAYEACACD